MMKSFSNDLRTRIVEEIEAGSSLRSVAERFRIAPSGAIKLHRNWRETGSVDPAPQGGDKRSGRIEALSDEILALVEVSPDITLVEIASHLESGHGERFAASTVHRFFQRRGITFKKTGHAAEQARAD